MAGKERHEMKVAVLAGGISDEREISLASGKNAAAALTEAGYGTVEMVDPGEQGFLSRLENGNYDVAFIALHGFGGEDGMTQHILEFLGIPYTGSNSLASGIAMDKDLPSCCIVARVCPLHRVSPSPEPICRRLTRSSRSWAPRASSSRL
ncbi:MAG: hypothetical protein ACLTSX_04400 [Collinsella sp.]